MIMDEIFIISDFQNLATHFGPPWRAEQEDDKDVVLPRGLFDKRGQFKEIADSIIGGMGNREIARNTGASKTTVRKYRAILEKFFNKTFYCPCGQPATHQGWCKFRFMRSQKRQKFMRCWHKDFCIHKNIQPVALKPKAQLVIKPILKEPMKQRRFIKIHFNSNGAALCGETRGRVKLVPEWQLVTCQNCANKVEEEMIGEIIRQFKITPADRAYLKSVVLKPRHLSQLTDTSGNVSQQRIKDLWSFCLLMNRHRIVTIKHAVRAYLENPSIRKGLKLSNHIQRASIEGLKWRIRKSPLTLRDYPNECEIIKEMW